ncbi:MAG: Gfo/Idh/MocA family oxidoreductase [Ignavibacteria bacterium]|jgi:predicted dehydrogenase
MLKGAIIGFGKIVQNSHLPAFLSRELSKEMEITAVVEPDAGNREISQSKYPFLNFYLSTEELYKNEDIDFVDIAAPPKYHADLIEAAAEHKLNIICEKPFTFNAEEAGRIKKIIEDKKIIFIPCHQYRYSPLWQKFKEVINETCGKDNNDKSILQFNVYRTSADPGLDIFDNPWRVDLKQSGGGIIADTGIHYLYLSNWLLGKPLRISAVTDNIYHKEYKVEDTGLIIAEFEKGISQITLTWGSSGRGNSASLISPHANLYYRGGNSLVQRNCNAENDISHPVPDVSDKASYVNLYIELFNEFLETIKKRTNYNFLDEAYLSVKMLEACYSSASLCRMVLLNE